MSAAVLDGGGGGGGRIEIVAYSGEAQLPAVQALIDRDLSEPYSIFTHRFFLHRWPQLCFLAMEESGAPAADGSCERVCVGAVVGKLVRRGGARFLFLFHRRARRRRRLVRMEWLEVLLFTRFQFHVSLT